jgi:hypothetical protein
MEAGEGKGRRQRQKAEGKRQKAKGRRQKAKVSRAWPILDFKNEPARAVLIFHFSGLLARFSKKRVPLRGSDFARLV